MFQAIEEIWGRVKAVLRRLNASCKVVDEVRKMIDQAFNQISGSCIDHWKNAFDNVLKVENMFNQVDIINENVEVEYVELLNSQSEHSE